MGRMRLGGGRGWRMAGIENICYIPINPLQKLIRGVSACHPILLLYIYYRFDTSPVPNAAIDLRIIYNLCQGACCGQWALRLGFPSLEPLAHTACSCQTLLMYTLNFLSNSLIHFCCFIQYETFMLPLFVFLLDELLLYYQ